MPEVLLTYESVVQEPDVTGIMEPELDEVGGEDQPVPDAEANEDGDLQRDETVEQSENHVYDISHGDGQKHSGTIEQAMKDCPAMRGKSREEIRQIMDKRAAADRVMERRREKKRAEAAEKAKTDTTEKTERTSDRDQVKERKAERDTKTLQEANTPAKERPESIPAAAAKASEVIIPDSVQHVPPEKPLKPIVHEQDTDEHEPAVLPSAKAHEDTGAGSVVVHPRVDFSAPLGAESARQPVSTSAYEDVRQLVDTFEVASRVDLDVAERQVIEPLDARLIEDVALWDSARQTAEAAVPSVDALIAESASFGPDSGTADGEAAVLSADELRQLFGIVVEHDVDDATQTDVARTETLHVGQSIGADAILEVTSNSTAELRQLFGIDEHDVEEGAESVLDSEVMEIRQAFLAVGHDGGEALEDLVALDIELDEQVADDEYAALPATKIGGLQSEELLSSDLALDALEAGEDNPTSIMLPRVQPEFLETNVDADGVVDARASTEVAGALQEALQLLEPDQAVAVEDFLASAARAVERLERITELGEGDRVPVERELEVLCAELFDALGIDRNDELIRHFIDGIVSPDTLTITRDGTLSPLDIALLNYLGTNEYKGDEQASLLKTIMQAVRDWLRHQRWLGRCALKLARDAFPARPMYSPAAA